MKPTRGREAWGLLTHFTLPVDRLWGELPDNSGRDFVLVTESQTSRPLEALALILAEIYLVGWGDFADLEDPELDVLDDLRVLLTYFLSETRSEIFDEPEEAGEEDIIGTPYMVWRVVRRLCRVALSRPSLQRHAGQFLPPSYYFQRFSEPF